MANGQIDRTGDQPLPEGAFTRCYAIDKRGKMIVEAPANAGQPYQAARANTRHTAIPRQ